MEQNRHQFLSDAVLSEHSATVEQRLSEYAAGMETVDLQALMDSLLRDLFERMMNYIEADLGTIWLADAARTKLVVSYSHSVPELVGQEQPLDEGLISLVLGSEQAICENKVYANARHSKRIDEALGMVTCAMITAPFYLGGSLRGVVSCVQSKETLDDPDPPGFTGANLNRVKLLAAGLERLLNYELLKIILDVHV